MILVKSRVFFNGWTLYFEGSAAGHFPDDDAARTLSTDGLFLHVGIAISTEVLGLQVHDESVLECGVTWYVFTVQNTLGSVEGKKCMKF